MEYCEIIKNTSVYGLSESIRGAKFPMSTDVEKINTDLTQGIKKLAMSTPGAGHSTWLQGVVVQFDLTFTAKAWTEFERYHFVDFVTNFPLFKLSDINDKAAYMEYTNPEIIRLAQKKLEEYNSTLHDETNIEVVNQKYLELIYSIPAGFKLTARISTNYRQLQTIYSQRRTHRLPEWQAFCDWCETLPYSEFITGKEEPASATD